jgi:O-antigen ligase
MLLTSLVFFKDIIISNEAYKHFIYFFSHTDFSTFEFNDASTGNRLFEALQVINVFSTNDIIHQIFGNGFGATIDLSSTIDETVLNTNPDPTKVHHIHMGIFAVLHRYGILGLIIYITFIFYSIRISFQLIKKSKKLYIKLASFYIIILIFDSMISFPHMMSNYFFWFSFALIIREKKNFNKGYIYYETK